MRRGQRTLARFEWLRFRYAALDADDGSSRDDVRFMVSYEIPLL